MGHMSSFIVLISTILAISIQATPVKHQTGGEEYVVIFHSHAPTHDEVLSRVSLKHDHSDVRYTYNNSAFRGFSAHLPPQSVDALGNMTDMMHVEKAVTATAHVETRTSTPWGLQRISSNGYLFGNTKALDFTYSYQNPSLGSGVDIYVVDTGINTDNEVFEGRARMGFSFENNYQDQDGHGTHVSGTAGGNIVGVASGANIIGAKVLGASGAGTTSDTIAGMDYVANEHENRKTQSNFVASIMSMSWGLESTSSSISSVIDAALAKGIHVSVAAGNNGKDACSYSPSNLGGQKSSAISVGSVGYTAAISSFSDTGPCVDIYAPGENVLSSWIGGDNVLQYLSGTSMATPHVTGVMAYLAESDSELASNPAAMKAKILDMALKGFVTGSTIDGDTKLLLNNGVRASSISKREMIKGARMRGVKRSKVAKVLGFEEVHLSKASIEVEGRIHDFS